MKPASCSGVVADDHGDGRRDVEAGERPCRRRPSRSRRRARRRTHPCDAVRREEDRQPAVGDLRRQRDVLRPDRREVDRDVGAARVHDDLERLAEAGRVRAAVRDVVVLAVVLERLLARSGSRARSRRTRACARAACRTAGRASPRRPAGRTTPSPSRKRPPLMPVERRRGHRGHRRGARRHLHDRGAELDALGVRHRPGERRDRVGAVGLGGPRRVEAE